MAQPPLSGSRVAASPPRRHPQAPYHARQRANRSRPEATPDEILAGHTSAARRIAQRLRDLIGEVVPEAVEKAHPGWHAIGYRHPQAGYVCGILPRERSVKLGFEWGAQLRDEDGLLRRGPSGGKQVRYAELADADAIPEDALALLLLEAVSLRSGRAHRT